MDGESSRSSAKWSQPSIQETDQAQENIQNVKKPVPMQHPSQKRKERGMRTLKVPGAQLSYEVTGHGPLLILIPGAKGEGAVSRPLAQHLSAQHQVVTYDRRGFSR